MSSDLLSLLLFDLEHQRFGIPVADVREVVRAVALAKLPKAPMIVEGIVNCRGTAIAVLDIRSRFRLPPKQVEPSDHLIIASAGLRTVALRVDRVVNLITMPQKDAIDEIANITPHSEYIAGVAKLTDHTVLIHDLSRFLSAAEAADLDGAEEIART